MGLAQVWWWQGRDRVASSLCCLWNSCQLVGAWKSGSQAFMHPSSLPVPSSPAAKGEENWDRWALMAQGGQAPSHQRHIS